jgi:two-component system sensor histidine kinase/response regulator
MDIQMPVMDGQTATRLIHDDSQLKTVPVFALTPGVLDEEREAAGVNDFLTKPVDPDQLAATLASLHPQPDTLSSENQAVIPPENAGTFHCRV